MFVLHVHHDGGCRRVSAECKVVDTEDGNLTDQTHDPVGESSCPVFGGVAATRRDRTSIRTGCLCLCLSVAVSVNCRRYRECTRAAPLPRKRASTRIIDPTRQIPSPSLPSPSLPSSIQIRDTRRGFTKIAPHPITWRTFLSTWETTRQLTARRWFVRSSTDTCPVGHFSRYRGGDAWADALLAQPPTVFVVVVALVCANLSRFAAARTLRGEGRHR